jgi:hypothetical protein
MMTVNPLSTNPAHAWVNYSMRERVPDILREVLASNPDYLESIRGAITRLIHEIETDAPLRMPPDTGMPDYYQWAKAWLPRRGETWLNTQWFFAEIFAYRHLIEIVDWVHTLRDPFFPKKEEELGSPQLHERLDLLLRAQPDLAPEERLRQSLHLSLWGNRIDLSYALAMSHGSEIGADDLLVDDTPIVIEHLRDAPGAIHIVLDNFGTEYAGDLALVDTLLATTDREVITHYKAHPTFVSDVTLTDERRFRALLHDGFYGEAGRQLWERLESPRWKRQADWVWNSPVLGVDLPKAFLAQFNGAALAIFKGDLNYRRLVGDTFWPPTESFADVVAYFPTPVLALRTMKSPAVCGLPAGLAEKLDQVDADWRINGKRGLIQFAPRL